MAHWFDKHNLYSTMEAELIARRRVGQPSLVKAFFGRDPHERRMHQKRLFYRMPGRPLIKFFYVLLFRGGCLDGPIGLHYALLQSIYEYMIVLKTREMRMAAAAPAAESRDAVADGDARAVESQPVETR